MRSFWPTHIAVICKDHQEPRWAEKTGDYKVAKNASRYCTSEPAPGRLRAGTAFGDCVRESIDGSRGETGGVLLEGGLAVVALRGVSFGCFSFSRF